MFAAEIRAGQVVVQRQYSQEALAGFPGEYLDWVYIDGAHEEKNVARDLDHPRVKMFLGLLLRLVPGMVELRNDPLDQYRHQEHQFAEGGRNIVMSF